MSTTTVEFAGSTYGVQDDETVLDALLRQGIPVPNSCKAGACQCCMMRAVDGEVPPESQIGLKPALKEQGYFLTCSCKPAGPLKLEAPGEGMHFETRIAELHDLGASVMQVKLETPDNFNYRSGQFLTLFSPDGTARSYSIASLPVDAHIELHIRRIPGGRMSNWIFEHAKPGDEVKIAGPAGECFYTNGNCDQRLILVGTGTGLAPLWGILRDALANKHQGEIVLYHGALEPNGLYHRDLLQAIATDFPHFTYHPCVVRNGDESVRTGSIDEIILSDCPSLKNYRAFLCGNPELVGMLKKKFFLAGMNMKDISMDAFVPSPTTVTSP